MCYRKWKCAYFRSYFQKIDLNGHPSTKGRAVNLWAHLSIPLMYFEAFQRYLHGQEGLESICRRLVSQYWEKQKWQRFWTMLSLALKHNFIRVTQHAYLRQRGINSANMQVTSTLKTAIGKKRVYESSLEIYGRSLTPSGICLFAWPAVGLASSPPSVARTTHRGA